MAPGYLARRIMKTQRKLKGKIIRPFVWGKNGQTGPSLKSKGGSLNHTHRSDSNFLWHESEDIDIKKNKTKQNKKQTKNYFQNFSSIPISSLQVMYDYVVFHCSIDYCVE